MAGIDGVGRFGVRNYVAPVSLSSIVTNGLVLNLDAGNVASYPGTGTAWTDLSGNGNNATLVNGTSYSSSNGGALVFDGINDYVQGPNLLYGLSKATLCGWVKKTSTTSVMSFGVMDSLGGKRIEIVWYLNGNLYGECGGNDNFWVNSLPPKIDTGWHFICFTYDGSQSTNYGKVSLYFDGALLTNSDQYNTIDSSITVTGPLVIGNRVTGYSTGMISNIQIYNKVLSASEILQNFNATKSRFGFTSYTARTQALIAATGLTDTTKINAINTFDLGLISNSIPFGANDALYLGFLGDSDKNKFNFIDTTKYQLTFYGGWDFTNGMKGNSVNTYAKTGWIPSARITNNDGGAIGAYLRNDFGSDQHFMGVGHAGSYFDPYPYGGGIYPSINDGNNTYYIPTRKRGGIDIARTSSTNISCLSDSTTYNVTQNFTGKNGYEVYIGAMNHLGGPYGIYNNDIVCAYISANQWTQSQQLAFSALRSTMLTTLGLNV